MFHLIFHNLPHDFSYLEHTKKIYAQVLNHHVSRIQKGQINIVFSDEDTIHALNKKYRNKNKSTDILTFSYFEDFSECSPHEVAGEILLCENIITTQAQEAGHSITQEIKILLVHGLVHMMGYDHETEEDYQKMKPIEEAMKSEIPDDPDTQE